MLVRAPISFLAVILAGLVVGCSPKPEADPVDDVVQGLSGTFRIESVSSGKCVDVPGASTETGVQLHQWTCHGKENQQWQVKSLGGGEHQILSVGSGLCADLKGGSGADGAAIQQFSCRGNDNQKWRITSVGGGAVRVQSVKSGKCWGVAGSGSANGVLIEQVGCSSDQTQRFKFAATGGGSPPSDPPGGGNPGDGNLTFRKANLTNFTSYPDPGSEECVKFNGCMWAGMFAALDGKQPLSWVMSHNIAAVHSKDFNKYKLKTLRLKKGGKTIDVVVYDMCADSDCSGCCTDNSRETGFLIDIESFTAERFGVGDGIVDWACVDCN
jgi:hypothetical protein